MEPPALTTEETYKKNVTAQGLPVDIESFDGYSLAWIGSKNAKQMILYMCGGAFVTHAYDVHVINLINGYNTMKANGQDVSIAILCYGLTPTTPWPTQIRQIVGAVQHLLKSRAPETINFSGDSAGGTLTLALLLHHSHPHPSVAPLTLPYGSRFGNALLISPGAPVPAIRNTVSFNQDPNPDVIKPEMVDQFWSTIISTSEKGVEMPNPWIENSSAPEGWWKGLPVSEVKIIVGGAEVIRDDIAAWSTLLEKYHDKLVEVKVFPGEIHEQGLIDMLMGVTDDADGTKYWKKWFQDFRS